MKKLENIIVALWLIFALSCGSILEPTIEGQVALDALLTSESGMITAVNGIYQPLQAAYKDQMIPFLADMASDDGWTWRKETEFDIFIIEPSSIVLQNIWSNHYTGIARANTVLDKIQNIEDFSSEKMKNAIEGQAKFMRAFYYFNLVRLFGPVPLIVSEIKDRKDSEQPRSSIEKVYEQIKSDLTEAINLLPDSYSGSVGMEKGRPTNYSAYALKSIVHLELGEWNDVIQASSTILSKGNLLQNFANNFNGVGENGVGSFFEVQYGGVTNSTTTDLSNAMSPPDYSGLGSPLPTDDSFNGSGGGLSSGNGLVQLYEENDLRKDVTIASYGLPNFINPSRPAGSLYFVNKFRNVTDPRGLSTWNYPLIRYAEILLIRAEALNELGYQANGEAFELLNKIRKNAGIPQLNSSDLPNKDAFRLALQKEKRIELAFEAKRYFDLNRLGILREAIQMQMNKTQKTFPSNKMITHPITGKEYFLFPIPDIEFTNNANMGEQNPGY